MKVDFISKRINDRSILTSLILILFEEEKTIASLNSTVIIFHSIRALKIKLKMEEY